MNRKAQSALEYLMTYGWALIVIAIVIGILWYVTSTATGGVTCMSRNNNFVVTASMISAGTDGVNLTIRNGTANQVTVNSATGAGSFSGAGTVTGSPVAANETFSISGIDAPAAGTTFDDGAVTVNVTYAGLTADFNVVCSGKV